MWLIYTPSLNHNSNYIKIRCILKQSIRSIYFPFQKFKTKLRQASICFVFSLLFFCLQPTGLKKKFVKKKCAEHFLASPQCSTILQPNAALTVYWNCRGISHSWGSQRACERTYCMGTLLTASSHKHSRIFLWVVFEKKRHCGHEV